MGGESAARILAYARERGVVTSADILAPGDPGLLEWIAPALEHLDHLLLNEEQVLGFAGAEDLGDGCRALLARGVGCVAATRGGDGALVVTAEHEQAIPALAVDVVDTTGCGDAFSAGYLRGLSLGRDPAGAARVGCAAGAFVAHGLGTRPRRIRPRGRRDARGRRLTVSCRAAPRDRSRRRSGNPPGPS
jgi:sugar/nucleoside kinase (ribokinase family)